MKSLTHYWILATIVTVYSKFRFQKRRDHEKISYERRVYETVDDESLS